MDSTCAVAKTGANTAIVMAVRTAATMSEIDSLVIAGIDAMEFASCLFQAPSRKS